MASKSVAMKKSAADPGSPPVPAPAAAAAAATTTTGASPGRLTNLKNRVRAMGTRITNMSRRFATPGHKRKWLQARWQQQTQSRAIEVAAYVTAAYSIYWAMVRFNIRYTSFWPSLDNATDAESVSALTLLSVVYVVAELLILAASLLAARRFYRFTRRQAAQGPSLDYVGEDYDAHDKRGRCMTVPQVMRWDLAGVLASNFFGKVASLWLPVCLRPLVYGAYAKWTGANLDEIAEPLEAFPCLNDFFIRQLRPGVRSIDATAPVVSPVDARVTVCGRVHGDHVEQVKGVTYSLQQFLGCRPRSRTGGGGGGAGNDDDSVRGRGPRSALLPKTAGAKAAAAAGGGAGSGDAAAATAAPGQDGEPSRDDDVDDDDDDFELRLGAGRSLFHIVLYLAPGDYHRFHSPCRLSVQKLRHFPGTLFPISPLIARMIPNLFALNERVSMLGEWPFGFFSMTPVGAYNVGSIVLEFDGDISTNRIQLRNPNLRLFSVKSGHFAHEKQYAEGKHFDFAPGDDVGHFRLGSTVVLIFEAPDDFEFSVTPGQKVRLGQALGRSRTAEQQFADEDIGGADHDVARGGGGGGR